MKLHRFLKAKMCIMYLFERFMALVCPQTSWAERRASGDFNHKKIPLPLPPPRSSQDLSTRGSYNLFSLAQLESESKKLHLTWLQKFFSGWAVKTRSCTCPPGPWPHLQARTKPNSTRFPLAPFPLQVSL